MTQDSDSLETALLQSFTNRPDVVAPVLQKNWSYLFNLGIYSDDDPITVRVDTRLVHDYLSLVCFWMASINACFLIGFVTRAVHPASRVRWASSSIAWAVRAMIGV